MIRIIIMKPSLKCDIRLCFVINFNYKNALFFGKSHIAHLSLYQRTWFFAYQFQTASVLCCVLHFSSITPAVLPVSTMCIFVAANFCVGLRFFCETLCRRHQVCIPERPKIPVLYAMVITVGFSGKWHSLRTGF